MGGDGGRSAGEQGAQWHPSKDGGRADETNRGDCTSTTCPQPRCRWHGQWGVWWMPCVLGSDKTKAPFPKGLLRATSGSKCLLIVTLCRVVKYTPASSTQTQGHRGWASCFRNPSPASTCASPPARDAHPQTPRGPEEKQAGGGRGPEEKPKTRSYLTTRTAPACLCVTREEHLGGRTPAWGWV